MRRHQRCLTSYDTCQRCVCCCLPDSLLGVVALLRPAAAGAMPLPTTPTPPHPHTHPHTHPPPTHRPACRPAGVAHTTCAWAWPTPTSWTQEAPRRWTARCSRLCRRDEAQLWLEGTDDVAGPALMPPPPLPLPASRAVVAASVPRCSCCSSHALCRAPRPSRPAP